MIEPEIRDRTSVVYDHNNLTTEVDDGDHGTHHQTKGCVRTQDGIVEVYASAYRVKARGWSYRHLGLTMVHGGRQVERRINGRIYSERFIVTLAKRFADDVAAGRVAA